VQDPERDGWLLYRRPPALARQGGGSSRRISVGMSRDLKNWSYARNISILDEQDSAASRSMIGTPVGVDSFGVVRHGDIFIGHMGVIDDPKVGPWEQYLVWSRDGLEWRRLADRLPYPSFGMAGTGEWDGGWVSAPTRSKPYDPLDPDHTWIYYDGVRLMENQEVRAGRRGMGLAFMGRDRYVGWHGELDGGRLLTREFVLEGDRLEINCQTLVQQPFSAELPPQIKAEILEPLGKNFHPRAYDGFAMADCDSVPVGDEFRRQITWKGSADLSALRGKRVYLRFFIRGATLYTFRVADSRTE